jgi:hypothetical protein
MNEKGYNIWTDVVKTVLKDVPKEAEATPGSK